MLSLDYMNDKEHGSVTGTAEPSAPSLEVPSGLGSNGHLSDMTLGHRSVYIERSDQKAVRDIVGGQGKRHGLTLFDGDFGGTERKSAGMDFDAPSAGLREGTHREQERDEQTEGNSDAVFHLHLFWRFLF
jgi:hypothetical protein